MIIRVLSLDLSLASTGWAYTFGQVRGISNFGTIKTKPKFSKAERLFYFRNELTALLQEFRPTHIVIEDIYKDKNVSTTIALAEVRGVAQECCFSVAGIQPYIISTNTVKAYFKAKNKEELFNFIVDIFGWNPNEVSFKKHNDVTDAIAQLIVYYDQVLDYRKFREEKEYGFLYEI